MVDLNVVFTATPQATAGRILALDLGTSSVRAMVLDPGLRPVALARRPVQPVVVPPGAGTLDPASYAAKLVDCLDELNGAGWLAGVHLVAASAQWHSIVPVGRDGQPLGPVLTWLDSRPGPVAQAKGPADDEAFHARTGAWWHSLYWTVRIPWLRSRLGTGIVRFIGLPEYVFGLLLDETPMSVSHASGTGLLDLAGGSWDAEACGLAGVRPGELPPIAPQSWRGRLGPAYAARWPALAGAQWLSPVGDGAASNAGSGCLDAGHAAVTVGTSAAVRLIQPAPVGGPLPPLPAQLWRYRVDHERIVTGAAHSNGGNLYAWAQRVLRLPEGDGLEAALQHVEPGSAGWADPRLGGDRPPGHAPAGSGELRGLGFTTTAVDMLAALMYAVCRQIALDVEHLEASVGAPVSIVLGGGAVAASAWWRRAFAVALAPRDVRHVSDPEVGATGAAVLATA